jgi:hypothetical protein
MGTEFFASPLTVLVSLLVALASAVAYYVNSHSPLVSKRSLAAGYLAVILASALLCAVSAYVSPGEANNKWQVPPDRYWAVLLNSYLTQLILFGSAAVIGVALVGFPIVLLLGRFGNATTPAVLVASLLVSAATALLLSSGDVTPYMHLGRTLAYLVGTHGVLALSFCLGAGIPWRRAQGE